MIANHPVVDRKEGARRVLGAGHRAAQPIYVHSHPWAILWLLIFLFSIACLTAVFGGETAQFLKIGVGARPVSTGYSVSTIIDDLNALTYNPAGLAHVQSRQASFTHAQLFDESTKLDFLGYAQPLSISGLPETTFGGGVTYLSQGTIDGRDASRQPTGGVTASDMSLQAGVGMRVSDSIRLGTSVRYIESHLAASSARTMAFDFGGQWLLGNFQYGAAIRNLGPGLKYMDETGALPMTWSLGTGYRFPSLGLLISADFSQRPETGESQFSVGSEYAFLPTMTLRAGYLANLAAGGEAMSPSTAGSSLGSLGTGLGLKILGSNLDYAFTPMGPLGAAHRISLSTNF